MATGTYFEILGRNDAGDYLHVIVRRSQSGQGAVIVFHMARMNDSDRKRFRRAVQT